MNGEDRPAERTSVLHGPYWLIRDSSLSGDERADLLTLEIEGYGTTMPIFSVKEDAVTFLKEMPDHDSRQALEAAYTDRVRLASALIGPLAGVDRIVFDPLPEPHLSETVRLSGLGRRAFLDLMLGRGKSWSARPDHGRRLRDGQDTANRA